MIAILVREGSAITNITHLVDNYHAVGFTKDISPTTEIYLGSLEPFNNFYIDIEEATANGNTANLSVEYWEGRQFQTAAQVFDQTEEDNATFAKSGFISFTPDALRGWVRADSKQVPELSDQIYYGLYWARLTFGAELTLGTKIKYLSYLFCTDQELYGEFPKFNTVDWLDAWGEDKVDWLEQRIIASKLLIGELKSIGKISDKGQILDRQSLRDACVQMTAHIIYNSSGINYEQQATDCYRRAMQRVRLPSVKVDKNKDAIYNNTDKILSAVRWSR